MLQNTPPVNWRRMGTRMCGTMPRASRTGWTPDCQSRAITSISALNPFGLSDYPSGRPLMQSAEVMTLNSSIIQCAERAEGGSTPNAGACRRSERRAVDGSTFADREPAALGDWTCSMVSGVLALTTSSVSNPQFSNIGDDLYDSARVAHDTRWDLPLLEQRQKPWPTCSEFLSG